MLKIRKMVLLLDFRSQAQDGQAVSPFRCTNLPPLPFLQVYSPQKGPVRLYYRSFRMASGTGVPVIIQGCHLVFLHACANHICTWLSMVSI